MTEKARIVLQDCKHAVAAHTLDLQAEELRVSWVSILALLRAVGHVLDKVDATSSAPMKAAIRSWWDKINASKPEPRIFWEFIEQERNEVLKVYEFGIRRQLEFDGPEHEGRPTRISVDLASAQGGKMTSEDGEVVSHLRAGSFSGRPECEVAIEAIKWWDSVLDEIDEKSK